MHALHTHTHIRISTPLPFFLLLFRYCQFWQLFSRRFAACGGNSSWKRATDSCLPASAINAVQQRIANASFFGGQGGQDVWPTRAMPFGTHPHTCTAAYTWAALHLSLGCSGIRIGCWRFIPITNLNSIYALKARGVRRAACFIASPGELLVQVGGLCSWVTG